MSLNGLDASEVAEAYQSALSEGGGWYARDQKHAQLRVQN